MLLPGAGLCLGPVLGLLPLLAEVRQVKDNAIYQAGRAEGKGGSNEGSTYP